MKKDCSAVILSAGFSSRMKSAKFALKFDKNRTFLEKIVEEYFQFGCKEIICVLNEEGIKLKEELNLNFPDNIGFAVNKFPERERFFSLQIGLKAMTVVPSVFIHNVDNPFVNQEVLNSLYQAKDTADYIVPTYKGKGGHPILINYPIVKSTIYESDYNLILKDFLEQFHQFRIENKEDVILNINTQDQLKQYLKNK